MQKEKDKKELQGSIDPEENLKRLKELKAKQKKIAKAKLREKISLG
jgi:hypothetical protein